MPMFSVLAMLHHRLQMLVFFLAAGSSLRSVRVGSRFIAAAMRCVHAAKRDAHAACRSVALPYAVGLANPIVGGLTDKDHRSADGGF